MDHKVKFHSFFFTFFLTFPHFHFFFALLLLSFASYLFSCCYLLVFMCLVLLQTIASSSCSSSHCFVHCLIVLPHHCFVHCLIVLPHHCLVHCLVASSRYLVTLPCCLATLPHCPTSLVRTWLCYHCSLLYWLTSLPRYLKVPFNPPTFVVFLLLYLEPCCFTASLPCVGWYFSSPLVLFCREELGAWKSKLSSNHQRR